MNTKEKIEEMKTKSAMAIGVAKLKIKDTASKVVDWARRNPEMCVTIISSVIGLTYRGVKSVKRYNDEHIHDKEVYDPRLQMWHPVRRKLTYDEALHYKTSVSSGRSAVDVLKEMRLYR